MTIKWSAVSAISLIRWDETKIVLPSDASPFMRFLIQRIPSGSRPLTGSSNMRISGSPSSAEAIPSRWPMPSENPFDFFFATGVSPTRSNTSATRLTGIRFDWARQRRLLYALRPPFMALASSSAPMCFSGSGRSR